MNSEVHGSLCDPSLPGFQGTPLASTTLSLGRSVQTLEALPPDWFTPGTSGGGATSSSSPGNQGDWVNILTAPEA